MQPQTDPEEPPAGVSTSFVGRETELAEIAEALSTRRLVTLTGAGGIGKTRLAGEVVRGVAGDFVDGVCFVDLATVGDDSMVDRFVATALGLRDVPGRPVRETLIDSLRVKRSLVLLDNCEHMIGPCAALVSALLGACSRLRILATSREPLGVVGEQVRSLAPLSCPRDGQRVRVEDLSEFEATRLFVERARSTFVDDPRAAMPIVEICRRLEGIPLAIEIAAAAASKTPLDHLAATLSDSLLAMNTRPSSGHAHHETLRAAIDWSYDTLAEEDRGVFPRLSVFAGGPTLWAIGAICREGNEGNEAVQPAIARLVGKSLLTAHERDGDVRYRLLEPVREYAAMRLRERGEHVTMRRLHRDWYLRFAEQQERLVWKEPRQDQYLKRIDGEIDNLRSALAWSRDNSDAEELLRLGAALGQYWVSRGLWSEGRSWIERGLESNTMVSPLVRARALHAIGFIVLWQGEAGRAREYLEESVALRRSSGEAIETAMGLRLLANILLSQGDHETAERHLAESLALFRQRGHAPGLASVALNLGILELSWGDREHGADLLKESLHGFREIGHTMGVAAAVQNLGEHYEYIGDCETASQYLEESLALGREVGDARHEAHALRFLGHVAVRRGELDDASELLRSAMQLDQELGHVQGIVLSVEAIARLVARRGEAAGAMLLVGAADGLREANHQPASKAELEAFDEWFGKARIALGGKAVERYIAEGRATPPQELVERFL